MKLFGSKSSVSFRNQGRCETIYGPLPPVPLFDVEAGTKQSIEQCLKEHKEEHMSLLKALEALPLNKENINTFEDAMDSVYKNMREIMISKQLLRGPGNIDNQGLLGVVTRMKEDKLERIMKSVKGQAFRDQLLKDGVPLVDVDKWYPSLEESEKHAEDSLEDDLLDVANYAIICIMVQRGIWGKPVEIKEG